MIDTILSGGQTGVDRAALDVAIDYHIQYGGWCPQGRIDENGKIPAKYSQLKENVGKFKNDIENYAARSIRNVQDADGTLLIVPSLPLPATIQDGTLLTQDEVNRVHKPYLVINLAENIDTNVFIITTWITQNNIKILNIAGPRESSWPGIYRASVNLLTQVIFRRIEYFGAEPNGTKLS